MVMVRAFLVIFDTGATSLCYLKKLYCVELEENKPPRNIKGIAKDLEISGFVIVDYHVSIEIGCMIAL